jgi:hypothetical protein
LAEPPSRLRLCRKLGVAFGLAEAAVVFGFAEAPVNGREAGFVLNRA